MLLSAAAGFLLAVFIFRPWQSGEVQLAHPTAPSVPASPAIDRPLRKVGSTIAPHGPMAELVLALGTIMMLPPGGTQWEEMRTGGQIQSGTRIRTGPQGRCEFRTSDGSEIRLNVGTQLIFHSHRQLELAAGRVWSTVARHEVPYQVIVPQAAATITALGTQFDVDCLPDQTVLTVVEGVTKVEGQGGDGVEVHARETAKIIAGSVADKRAVYDLVLATSWIHEILKLKGADHPELQRRMNDLFAQIGSNKLDVMVEQEIIDLGDHCVIPLTRFIQSERSAANPQKRVRAAAILATIAQPSSIPDLIQLLDDTDGEVRYNAAVALRRLTGGQVQFLPAAAWRTGPEDIRATAVEKWRTWWRQNEHGYPPGPRG
jgi:hypothetical protein